MANIRDVADSAGVSVATVSRTLQQPERVSPKTRNKVMAAVQAVGYKPNLMAVKFRSGKTHNLVVLVPTVANVFFARVISGMQEAAAELGYSILLANTLGNSEIESHYAKMVSTSQADGLQALEHNRRLCCICLPKHNRIFLLCLPTQVTFFLRRTSSLMNL